MEFHVIVWSLTRQFIGQIQTVDIRGLIIIVSLMKRFKYIHLFKLINVYHNLVKRTRKDITSQTFKVVSNSGMLAVVC